MLGKDQFEPVAFWAEYVGGHPMYPKKREVNLVLEREQLVVQEVVWGSYQTDNPPIRFSVPYKDIKRVENMTREKIDSGCVLLLGVLGALWKEEKTYMVVTSNDRVAKQEQSLVFDVEKLEEAQQALYQRVVAARSSSGL